MKRGAEAPTAPSPVELEYVQYSAFSLAVILATASVRERVTISVLLAAFFSL